MTTHMKIPSITSAPGTHFSFALRRDKCSYFVSPAHFFSHPPPQECVNV
jgi:hypothetical protein